MAGVLTLAVGVKGVLDILAVAVGVELEAVVDGLVLVIGAISIYDKVAGVLTLAVEVRVDAVFD